MAVVRRKHITGPLKGTDAAGLWDVAERGVTKARRTEKKTQRSGTLLLPRTSPIRPPIDQKSSLVSKPPRAPIKL